MKNFYSIIAIMTGVSLFASCSSENDGPQTTEDETDEAVVLTKEIETRAIEQANNFSYNLFNAVYDDIDNLSEKNIFISPLSVSMALSMVANGASGDTRSEIIKALGYDGVTTIDGINQVNAKLIESLPNVDSKVKFTIANALWVNNAYPVKETYTDKVSASYNATVDNLDFSKQASVDVINQWANDNTNGLIDNIISSLDPSSPLVLANALYFIGDWQGETFSTCDNLSFTNRSGLKTTVEGMGELNDILYNSNAKCQIATFKLGNGSYSYTAILPNANVSIKDAVASVSDEFIGASTKEFISFTTPKFNIKNDLTLNDYLKSLGVKHMFETNANFSKISDKTMFVDQVAHHTNIYLTEFGIEAAAVTSVYWDSSNGEELPKYTEFNIDRPFAFLIREESTGAIIFIGAVNKL